MRRLGALVAIVVLGTGCSTVLSGAKKYEDSGRHELAFLYFAKNYALDRDDAEAKGLAERSFDLAVRNMDADFEQATEASKYERALQIAVRKEAFVGFTHSIGLSEVAGRTPLGELEKARPLAAKARMSKADDAESGGSTPQRKLVLLREALALDPDDAELATSTRRLRDSLVRIVSVNVECPSSVQGFCDEFSKRIVDQVTAVRRELLMIVSQNSDRKNAQMTVGLEVSMGDTGWQRVKSGDAHCKVPVQDRFKQVVKDKFHDVRASYTVFERKTNASVTARVDVGDLRPPQATLTAFNQSARKAAAARYYTWQGDHRAFNATTYQWIKREKRFKPVPNPASPVKSHGTNATPPSDVRVLARQSLHQLADQVAKQIIAKLENAS